MAPRSHDGSACTCVVIFPGDWIRVETTNRGRYAQQFLDPTRTHQKGDNRRRDRITVAAPMATGAVGGTAKDWRDAAAPAALAPAQASPAQAAQVPSAVIRSSTRTAANRTWFQLTTLVATSSNPIAAPGSTLGVVVANGVTLRELIGFAYMNDRGAVTRSQIIGAPEWADTQRFDIIVPVPAGGQAGLTTTPTR